MAILIRGKLYSSWREAESESFVFRSEASNFQHKITSDRDGLFKPGAGRYCLIAGYGDPWSHRTILTRALKELQQVVALYLVQPVMTEKGWKIDISASESQNCLQSCEYVYELYRSSDFTFTGQLSVPILWDKATNQIVNNESLDIMHIFNQQFSAIANCERELYPPALSRDIDLLYGFVFDNINNGVYKVGFAPNQRIYHKAVDALFSALDELDEQLSVTRFLTGDSITLADICLFTTLIRFDVIYYPYLKCNVKRLQDYRHLWPYVMDIYHKPGVKDTVKLDAVMQTYYGLNYLNPSQVIPKPPPIDFGDGIEVMKYKMYSAQMQSQSHFE